MVHFFQYLDTHDGAFMVIITFVYVVATIAICIVNIHSAKATRDQLEESKRQYEEEHRAYISYELIYVERMWYGMRFTNHGRRIANDIQLFFSDSFINSINSDTIRNELLSMNGKILTLGIGQSYDVFFGDDDDFRRRKEKSPLEGKIVYNDRSNKYVDSFFIDFEKYPTIFSVTTSEEKIGDAIKKISETTESISHELQRMNHKLVTSNTKEKEMSLFNYFTDSQ